MIISAGIFFGSAIINLILTVFTTSFQASVIHLLLAILYALFAIFMLIAAKEK